ncbi:MAG: His/Gly/Thr/Pro-type tRNA ligase C-terminal domain-containing protein, partial [Thermoproteota archaeon]
QGIAVGTKTPQVWVAFVNDELQKIALNVVSQLRQKGIRAETDLNGRPLKKQMEMASNSQFTIIIAPKEYSSKSVVVRNTKDGTEKQILLESLLSDPQSNLLF